MNFNSEDVPPLRKALERVSEGVLTLDSDLRVTYANRRALDVLDVRQDEVVGKGLWGPRPEMDDGKREQIEQAMATGEETTYEYRTDDDTRWFEVRVYPDGEGATVMFTDITARKRREQQIRRLHETTRELIGADSRTEVADCICAAARKLLGLDMYGVHMYDEAAGGLKPVVIAESTREVVGDVPVLDDGIAWEVYQSGQARVHGDVREAEDRYNDDTEIRSEIVLPLTDQGVLILSSTTVDAFDDGDVTIGKLLASNASRVLEEIEANRQLRERRQDLERADKLFENAQDAFFVVDVTEDTFRIERVNPAYEELTGLSNSEIAGRTVLDIFGKEDGGAIRDRYNRCVERLEPIEYVETLDVPEPDTYWETHIAPVVVDDEVVQLVGATRNVTEQLERENRLQRQRDELELLNEMVRHDIRNDLQVISSYAELLEGRVAEDNRGYVRKVGENARTAVELTRTARDLAGTMLQSDEQLEPVPLRAGLQAQIDEVRTTYANAILKVEGAIPSVSVRADDMLASVFRNVIKNAIEHNDKDVPEVTIAVQKTDDTVKVVIADNGPGIPDNQKTAVFGRGEKGLDSDGTGIGLYLVDTLVDRYGGAVRIDDNEPEGTVITVVLDRVD